MQTTEFFGGITRQAVKDFQKDFEESILWVVGLKLPTGYFGKSSINKINSLLK
jgi:peptidoglycan hydrolase-like protein with peptidoglycan-binding domain